MISVIKYFLSIFVVITMLCPASIAASSDGQLTVTAVEKELNTYKSKGANKNKGYTKSASSKDISCLLSGSGGKEGCKDSKVTYRYNADKKTGAKPPRLFNNVRRW